MPFWWNRRRKFWYGRRYKRRNHFKRRKRRPRYYRRRKYRRPTRRRGRRRKKVRRKQKKITVKQWQPESIQKCKIKGFEIQLLGAEGCQHRCYTTYKYEWTIPKAPGGGGFASELYTLKYLYQEWGYRYNIWTRTNEYRDLCRYTGCKFTMYRDPQTDFIIAYDINPPFTLDKYTFMTYHPQQLLLRQHKKILLSRQRHPNGKMKLTFKIKPPKQMSTKWFFQQYFADFGLVNIISAAANFDYPLLGCCNENQIIHLYYLNTTFFIDSTWALYHTQAYKPNNQMSKENLTGMTLIDGKKTAFTFTQPNTYNDSISWEKGWFQPKILNCYKWLKPSIGNLPCGIARYNMNLDSGHGNKVWLTPINSGRYNVQRDEDLILENYPLWLIFYGFTSFIKQKKKDDSYFSGYMFVIKSDAIKPLQGVTHQEYYPIIDRNFMNGKAPGDTYLDDNMKLKWYPTVKAQLETINSIVQTGPYIPRYNNQRNSNWQLNSKYCFYFKWGGAQPTDQTVADPSKQPHWDVPDRLQQGVQVSDPKEQKWETIFKPWDYRRGSLTKKALKRMYEHLEPDESIFSDADTQSPKKKKRTPPTLKIPEQETQKISTCLHSLFEESTSQETQEIPQETTNILKLIQQQKQQQQQIKLNLFTLIQDLKTHQKAIQYQTGLLN